MATLRAVSARRLHALFQHAREPIFVLDSALRFVFANRAWEELTGRTAEDLTGLVCQPGQSPRTKVGSAESVVHVLPTGRGPSGATGLGHIDDSHISGERLPRRLEFGRCTMVGGG